MRVESDLLDPEVVVAEDQPSRARVAEAEEVVARNLEAEGEADAEFLLEVAAEVEEVAAHSSATRVQRGSGCHHPPVIGSG